MTLLDPATRSRGHDHAPDDDHEPYGHDLGLAHDLPRLLSRRRALAGLLTGAGVVALGACARTVSPVAGTAATGSEPTASAAVSASATGTASSAAIPEETAGPFPGDGSNGANVLTQTGVVRSDITSSFGGASGVAAGVPLTLRLTVVDARNGLAPRSGAAVYVWHADAAGQYSMYSSAVTQENYLRGVQAAADDGSVTFTSIYPGAYSGRWPHVHFEVYSDLASATTAATKLRTSQLALPEDVSRTVYAGSGYDGSLRNLDSSSLATDNVFRDGWSLQLTTVTGSVDEGYTASLVVPV